MRAYEGMRKKARDRRERRKTGKKIREPKVNEKLLVKAQPTSVTAKFIHPYEGPYIISGVIPLFTYELSATSGKVRGEFNKKALKPYLEEENSNAEGSK
jgi:hypothetical protein